MVCDRAALRTFKLFAANIHAITCMFTKGFVCSKPYSPNLKFEISNFKFRRRLAWLLFLPCLLLSLQATGRLCAQGGGQGLQINYQNQLLSISARNVDIKNFFSKLAEKTNITIEYPESLERKITLERENISLKRFLPDFLRNMNHVIIYSGSGRENSRIAEVRVYPKSTVSHSSVSTASGRSRDRIRQRIDSYRKIVEKLRNSLANVGENSNRGRVYVNRIRRYEDRIKKLENQLY